jgi:hypothetical protein
VHALIGNIPFGVVDSSQRFLELLGDYSQWKQALLQLPARLRRAFLGEFVPVPGVLRHNAVTACELTTVATEHFAERPMAGACAPTRLRWFRGYRSCTDLLKLVQGGEAVAGVILGRPAVRLSAVAAHEIGALTAEKCGFFPRARYAHRRQFSLDFRHAVVQLLQAIHEADIG